MDFNLKQQWRNEDQKTAIDSYIPAALPLFSTNHSSTPSAAAKFSSSGMGSYFNLCQWQELELQALIFRHMIAGAAIPPQLLHLVKTSLINSPYHHISQYLPQSMSHWGRAAMDPEPGRCRRTDGKKWRCSRDVVVGHKYCERHMHRGRNRSRKPVEIPTSTASAIKTVANASSGLTSGDLLHLSQSNVCRHSDSIIDRNGPFDAQNDKQTNSRLLRPFFDDWPKPLHENESAASSTALTISMPGDPSSDFSLKLGTGDNPNAAGNLFIGERDKPQLTWGVAGWAPMGGPLAEALRSSMSSSSPTSVLHPSRASEASIASST